MFRLEQADAAQSPACQLKLVKRAENPGADQGDTDIGRARSLFEQALPLFKADDNKAQAKTCYHLGYVERLAGSRENARQWFLRAVNLAPSYTLAKQQLDTL